MPSSQVKMQPFRFKGLMTIGEQGDISAFTAMSKLREEMCQKYQLDPYQFELSMGMSGDFEAAVNNLLFRLNIIPQALESEAPFSVKEVTQRRKTHKNDYKNN